MNVHILPYITESLRTNQEMTQMKKLIMCTLTEDQLWG